MDYKEITKHLKEHSSYFMDQDGMPYFQTETKELYPIQDGSFKTYVQKLHYQITGTVIPERVVADVQQAMISETSMKGVRKKIFTRVGKTDSSIEIDLNTPLGECISITKDGWNIQEPKCIFARPKSLRELTKPQKGGNWKLFKKHFNTKSDEDLMLLISFMIFAWQPNFSYPILAFIGEQGTGKSMATEKIKRLIDPSAGSRRGLMKNEKDIFIATKNCHLLSFDNISRIHGDLSDTLCRISTGGDFSSRLLYSNGEEYIIEVRKPIIANGITDFIQRPDLANRSIVIELSQLTESRKTESELLNEFENDLPLMMGALLEGVVSAMKNKDSTSIPSDQMPRLADFTKFSTAAAEGLGLENGSFIKAFNANQRQITIGQLSLDPVAIAIRSFMSAYEGGEWTGSATNLLREINEHKPYMDHSNLWASDATRLSSVITRLTPSLRTVGIEISKQRSASQRGLIIRKSENFNELNKEFVRGTNFDNAYPVKTNHFQKVNYTHDDDDANDAYNFPIYEGDDLPF